MSNQVCSERELASIRQAIFNHVSGFKVDPKYTHVVEALIRAANNLGPPRIPVDKTVIKRLVTPVDIDRVQCYEMLKENRGRPLDLDFVPLSNGIDGLARKFTTTPEYIRKLITMGVLQHISSCEVTDTLSFSPSNALIVIQLISILNNGGNIPELVRQHLEDDGKTRLSDPITAVLINLFNKIVIDVLTNPNSKLLNSVLTRTNRTAVTDMWNNFGRTDSLFTLSAQYKAKRSNGNPTPNLSDRELRVVEAKKPTDDERTLALSNAVNSLYNLAGLVEQAIVVRRP
ncbi:CUN033 putative gp41 tegument protein, similar to AcMNPV ORF80 [Culex nigripalpus nucleopolyhedrovirus]|uniref:CUN033 putative gp41 tegument protein, similar to AcMNPV ORF80 n=1 Tax=Culex nigripalpus nucleopolyhedrovirus (isolate Florida/1997) TaxID=645993 RepID=Q919N6_NPVCO|nr:CUN033 putative gp41 tegument protein, similar to AcMNPV ORF80 [Culex nigripalpus nucleopolyhedrovirus]AAK94111.1 CUN033 putative gp41 tegument protein, similar to AcMNPV ORF80 [Culex nigripalpus nucleopolyhedrovirus]